MKACLSGYCGLSSWYSIYTYLVLVDTACTWAHEAIMANHGQNCCAGSRTFVQEDIYDAFVQKCRTMAENRKVGDPWLQDTLQGPQVQRNFGFSSMFN